MTRDLFTDEASYRQTIADNPGDPAPRGVSCTCRTCGSAFTVKKSKADTSRYCSVACLGIGRRTRSGLANTLLYRVWFAMLSRCNNSSDAAYKDYGGRGIKVCEEWSSSFEAFYDWAHANGYRQGLTIDREKNDEGYSPDNCRWADRRTQNLNKRDRSNRTGFKGVTRDGRCPHAGWLARVTIEGKRKSLGVFKTAEEAARAVKEANS